MCLKYRMNTNSKNDGFFSGIMNAAKNMTQTVSNAVTGNKKNVTQKKNNSVKPITAGVNAPTVASNVNSTLPMKGGVAPVNFKYPANMQQPSERVMQWATTAGLPVPPESEMRNVAHGGSRRNRSRRNRSRGLTRRNRTKRNKSHGGKRRNVINRNRRNKSY
jgi:hypothetical protein